MTDFNAAVEAAIGEDLYGPDGTPPSLLPAQPQQDPAKFAVAALEVVERHLTGGLTPEQLAGLALLRLRGGRYAELADWFLQHYHRQGPVEPLLRAVEGLSLFRQFKGVSGRLFGGRALGPGVGR